VVQSRQHPTPTSPQPPQKSTVQKQNTTTNKPRRKNITKFKGDAIVKKVAQRLRSAVGHELTGFIQGGSAVPAAECQAECQPADRAAESCPFTGK